MVYKSGPIFFPFCHNPRVWQTDRQTDGRTDGRTDRNLITIPRLHYMLRSITCSAVKTATRIYVVKT